jgi:hypothetical protein
MIQRKLFDAKASEEARDEGRDRALRGASDMDKALFYEAILTTAQRMSELTTDDVCRLMPEDTPWGTWTGGLMTAAAKAGVIQKTDRVRKSVMVSCHARPKAIWRSLIFGNASSAVS